MKQTKHNRRHIFLTGPPRIGKTTIVLRVIEELKFKGAKIGGMISQEILEGKIRVGFKIIDLETNREGLLAHVKQRNGPRVGKYRVCLKDLNEIGAKAILRACKRANLIVIDEIGPMELYSKEFKGAVLEALNSDKIVLGTIHYRARTAFIDSIKKREDINLIEVTYSNRNKLPEIIVREIMKRIGERGGEDN